MHIFQKSPRCALKGACAVNRANTVYILRKSNSPSYEFQVAFHLQFDRRISYTGNLREAWHTVYAMLLSNYVR